MKMLLPDVNVWLALTFDSHLHHVRSKTWFDGLTNERCYFCRSTQQGFLRLATNPKAFGADAVTMDEAWRLYGVFLGDVRIAYAEERAGLESIWRAYTAGQSFSPKLWNDAYLAAFAKSAGWEIITFDQAFSQYHGVTAVILR
jgi:toxin-antitoxin system PIN domain toxin